MRLRERNRTHGSTCRRRGQADVQAVAERLTDEHGLVHRYCSPDGLRGEESSFGICTYWLAQAGALAGDLDRATASFEAITGLANDVGLLSKEVSGATDPLLGNFPQAFTHIGLINAAQAICERAADVAIGDHRNSRRVIGARLAVGS